MKLICLFYYCEKVFTHMTTWMIGKNSMKPPEKEGFYSHLNMEEINDAYYTHAKNVCKDFDVKDLGEYHDLCVESDKVLLVDVFENFRNFCPGIYERTLLVFLLNPD